MLEAQPREVGDGDGRGGAGELARVHGAGERDPRRRREPQLLMNSSSSPNFDELMNLFIKN